MNTSIEQVRKNAEVKTTKNGNTIVKFGFSKESEQAHKIYKNEQLTPAMLVKNVFHVQKIRKDKRFIEFAHLFYAKENEQLKKDFFEAVYKQVLQMNEFKVEQTGKEKAQLTPKQYFQTAFDAVYSMLLERMKVTFE